MCTSHVLRKFCHRVDRSFVCKAKEGRHVRIVLFLLAIVLCPFSIYRFCLPLWYLQTLLVEWTMLVGQTVNNF